MHQVNNVRWPAVKFSMKADYGIRALLDLAEHYGDAPVPCHEIARRQKVPGPFLDQLLMSLRRAGLVRSTRGPRGGHALAWPPEQITLAAAIDALEGSSGAFEASLDEGVTGAPGYGEVIIGVLSRAEAAARAVLAETSLAAMVQARRHEQMFHAIYHAFKDHPDPSVLLHQVDAVFPAQIMDERVGS